MITIIDYGLGNIGSIANTLASLRVPYTIRSDAQSIANAAALLLPGVGAAGYGMANLRSRGLDAAIRTRIADGVPFVGFCLGMQLLFEYSEEGNTKCLGILRGNVKKFRLERNVPQIGWNTVSVNRNNALAVRLFDRLPGTEFYFVNSYYPEPVDGSVIAATTDYGETFASAIVTGNVFATQFHPEKSGRAGLLLLQNFIKEIV